MAKEKQKPINNIDRALHLISVLEKQPQNARYDMRSLQQFIHRKGDFSLWCRAKIRRYKLIEGVHYDKIKKNKNRGRIEYFMDAKYVIAILKNAIIREEREILKKETCGKNKNIKTKQKPQVINNNKEYIDDFDSLLNEDCDDRPFDTDDFDSYIDESSNEEKEEAVNNTNNKDDIFDCEDADEEFDSMLEEYTNIQKAEASCEEDENDDGITYGEFFRMFNEMVLDKKRIKEKMKILNNIIKDMDLSSSFSFNDKIKPKPQNTDDVEDIFDYDSILEDE